MNTNQLAWYQKAIEHEISLISDDFVGNIDFKFNIKSNGITNMNINLAKSVKMPGEYVDIVAGKVTYTAK